MCKAWEDQKLEGKAEGKLETIKNALENGMSREDAERYLKATEKEMEAAEKMLG
ncbi:MAG: hypothetical protein PHP50_14530 [Lachnospiraceae bacterium]|nr:hypothetical protein [Lachnospiraceae bacterium]